ncbi:MAG: hypothetical protein JWO13_1867 [Acidobacteriales bacterium]|nr:hypothetical protein [Terriglobales bacterium]
MKSLRFLLSVALVSLSSAAFAQSDAHNHDAQNAPAQKAAAPKSEVQKSFDVIKSLAGDWEGRVDTDMSDAMKKQMGADMKPMHLSMRVTSRGNVLVHEFQEAGTPLDATKYDHPVTMLYVDAGTLTLVHYCDAGNRPRMTGKISPDGKRLEFDLVDVSGGTKFGHMHHAVFNLIDADHHTEEWTYMMPGDKPIHATFNLQRISTTASK